MSFSLGRTAVWSVIRLGLRVLGRKTMEMQSPSHLIRSGVPAINKTSHCDILNLHHLAEAVLIRFLQSRVATFFPLRGHFWYLLHLSLLNPSLPVLFPHKFPFCLNHSLQPPLQASRQLLVPKRLLDGSWPLSLPEVLAAPTQMPELFFKNASWIMVPHFSIVWILFHCP